MSGRELRMTLPTQRVLQALLIDPSVEKYGLEICAEAGLASGTIHPILARLESVGWVISKWEDINPHTEGRPRRRYYHLTPDGIERARASLARAKAVEERWQQARPRLAGGLA